MFPFDSKSLFLASDERNSLRQMPLRKLGQLRKISAAVTNLFGL
jgi:hypothetical protein